MTSQPTPFNTLKALSWLEVASKEDVLLIRICGLGNMHLALTLNEFINNSSEKGFDRFILDLEPCTGLDSTFMGTLLKLSEELSQSGGIMNIFNVSSTCQKLLEMLGVNCLLDICTCQKMPSLELTRVESVQDKVGERLKLIEIAHRRLVSLNDENKERFGTFLKMIGNKDCNP